VYLMLTGRKKPLPNDKLIITANARRRKETSPPTSRNFRDRLSPKERG
jgi:hypothetical protein